MLAVMSSEETPHAFISYVREDSDAVDELERVLTAAGVPVWRDVRSLFPGDVWKARIREAIQGNALAFIPVFSMASEARDRSQMREEIRLAIDEYRKMAPGQQWIFSVRLDDVEVPAYEISANQLLTDVNWIDFHGPLKTVQAVQLIAQVQKRLSQEAGQLATAAQVAASASDASRGTLLASAVRAGLTDPGRAADASQMLAEEARRVTAALNDEDRFPLTRPSGSLTAAAADRVEQLTGLLAPLLDGVAELGARGRPADLNLATQLVTSLTREGFATRGGLETLIALRKLPALLVMVSGAMGASATHNGQMFAAFTVAPRVDLHGRKLLVPSVLSPWDPFGPGWDLPQFILSVRTGAPVTNEVLDAYDHGNIQRLSSTQASDFVRDILQPTGQRFTVSDPEFVELVHRTEILTAATVIDAERDQRSGYSLAENWVGGHAVAERYAAEGLAQHVAAELDADGPRWWPLEGGLFGGDPERARAAVSTYATMAVEAGRRRHL